MSMTAAKGAPPARQLSPRETATRFIDTLQENFDAVSRELDDTKDRLHNALDTNTAQSHTVEELRTKLESFAITQASRDDYWKQQLHEANLERMLFLRYSVELSAQLQFVVAGCVRALKLAGTVQSLYAERSADGRIPEVPEADVAELESLMARISERAPRVDSMIKVGATGGRATAPGSIATAPSPAVTVPLSSDDGSNDFVVEGEPLADAFKPDEPITPPRNRL